MKRSSVDDPRSSRPRSEYPRIQSTDEIYAAKERDDYALKRAISAQLAKDALGNPPQSLSLGVSNQTSFHDNARGALQGPTYHSGQFPDRHGEPLNPRQNIPEHVLPRNLREPGQQPPPSRRQQQQPFTDRSIDRLFHISEGNNAGLPKWQLLPSLSDPPPQSRSSRRPPRLEDLPPAWSKGPSKTSQKRTATESVEARRNTQKAVAINTGHNHKRKEESEAPEPLTKRMRKIAPKNGGLEQSIGSSARPPPLLAPRPRRVLQMEHFSSPQLSQTHPTLVRPPSRRPASLHTVPPPPKTQPLSNPHNNKIVIDLTQPLPSSSMHLAPPHQSDLRKISQPRKQQLPLMWSGTRIPPSMPPSSNLFPSTAAPVYPRLSMQPATPQHYEQLLGMPPAPHPPLSQGHFMHSGPPLTGPPPLTQDFTFRAPAPPLNTSRSIAPPVRGQQLPKTFSMTPQHTYQAPNINFFGPGHPHQPSNTTPSTPRQPVSLPQVVPSASQATQQSTRAPDHFMNPAMIDQFMGISPSKQLNQVDGWDFLNSYFEE